MYNEHDFLISMHKITLDMSLKSNNKITSSNFVESKRSVRLLILYLWSYFHFNYFDKNICHLELTEVILIYLMAINLHLNIFYK